MCLQQTVWAGRAAWPGWPAGLAARPAWAGEVAGRGLALEVREHDGLARDAVGEEVTSKHLPVGEAEAVPGGLQLAQLLRGNLKRPPTRAASTARDWLIME